MEINNFSYINDILVQTKSPQVKKAEQGEETLFENSKSAFREENTETVEISFAGLKEFVTAVIENIVSYILPFFGTAQGDQVLNKPAAPNNSDTTENINSGQVDNAQNNSQLQQPAALQEKYESKIADIDKEIQEINQKREELKIGVKEFEAVYMAAIDNPVESASAAHDYEFNMLKLENEDNKLKDRLENLEQQKEALAQAVQAGLSGNTEKSELLNQKRDLLAEQYEADKKYSDALNNEALFFTYSVSGNSEQKITEQLNYDNFTSLENSTQYRLVTKEGKILAKSLDEANSKYRNAGDKKYTEKDIVSIQEAFDNPAYLQELIKNGELSVQQLTSNTTYENPYYLPFIVNSKKRMSESEFERCQAYVNAGGKSKSWLNKIRKTAQINYSWSNRPVESMINVATRLDTSDDAAAAAEYELKSSQIKTKIDEIDKKLKELENTEKSSSQAQSKISSTGTSQNAANVKTENNQQTSKTADNKGTWTESYAKQLIARYEKYIEKYERMIEQLENSNVENANARIASFEQKIQNYNDKILEVLERKI